MRTLKNYCLSLILDKDAALGIDTNKYQTVITALATNNHVEEICSYILQAVEAYYLRKKITPSDQAILSVLTTEFCVNRAYEYLMFLQNDHEYAHECELTR